MMQGEIITTGTEMITGQTANSNAGYIARRLHEAGLTAARLTTVGDQSPLIREVLEAGLGRSRFIIVTGGLGPTEDDVTVPGRGPGSGPAAGGPCGSVGPHPPVPGGAPDPLGGPLCQPGPDPGGGPSFWTPAAWPAALP